MIGFIVQQVTCCEKWEWNPNAVFCKKLRKLKNVFWNLPDAAIDMKWAHGRYLKKNNNKKIKKIKKAFPVRNKLNILKTCGGGGGRGHAVVFSN
jgi:hypothetical protein